MVFAPPSKMDTWGFSGHRVHPLRPLSVHLHSRLRIRSGSVEFIHIITFIISSTSIYFLFPNILPAFYTEPVENIVYNTFSTIMICCYLRRHFVCSSISLEFTCEALLVELTTTNAKQSTYSTSYIFVFTRLDL